MRVAELTLEQPFLLLFHPAAGFEGQSHHPLEVLVRHRHLGVGEEKLGQAAHRLVHSLDVAAGEGAAEVDPLIHHGRSACRPQVAPALAQEITHEAEVVGEMVGGFQLREIPAGGKRVQPVHERRVAPHLRRQRAQQVADPLLLVHVHIEVANHHDAAIGPDIFLAAAELSAGHVALHDVDAVLLVEGDARYLVEADDVVLADQALLARGVVHEHLRYRRLAARDQVGVGRDLLKQMALAGAAGAEFDEVVVPLHEGHHPQKQHAGRPIVE